MAKDLFSIQASGYAQYRPTYPPELFHYIMSFVENKEAAWDCATGNGQAAVSLAAFFDHVFATDISEKQLQQAVPRSNIVYIKTSEETTSLAAQSIDLVTVAQAYHWFNFDGFYKEVLRVARPGAVVAVWGYSLITCNDERIYSRIRKFYTEVVGPYWDKERRHVDDHYTAVPFPFIQLPGKTFSIPVEYDLAALSGYLNTWSSVQHYIKANGSNPVDVFIDELSAVWKPGEKYTFSFPLFLKIGKVSDRL
jgi:SAM-dependent methyltransferase